jgi:hypothetical protein
LLLNINHIERKEKASNISVFSVDGICNHYHELLDHSYPGGNGKTSSWTEMLNSSKLSSVIKLPEQHAYKAFENVSTADCKEFTMYFC